MQDYTKKVLILKEAINNQKQIEFCYKLEGKVRVINSHCLYINKLQVTMLDAWQESGQTDTSNMAFKCFVVQHMSKLKILDKTFAENSQFNHASIRYLNALVRIGG